MKEEVYEKFANKALTYIESTEAFLKEQLPDFFQQVVTYHAVQSWVFVGLSIIGIILSFWAFKRASVNHKKDEYAPETFIPYFIAGTVVVIFSVCSIGRYLPSALKATVAPKVFIVDYLRGKE